LSALTVFPIVEGHGDVLATPILLRRLGAEMFGVHDLVVLRPFRLPRTKIEIPGELERALQLGAAKLRSVEGRAMVLVLMDADEALPCDLAPKLMARSGVIAIDVACVLANPEFETWFVASARSLFSETVAALAPKDPEEQRARKKWVTDRLGGYSETLDQPRLAAGMDLVLCRERSPSFDKLCRELGKRLTG
jgi:hypothetical protein